MTGPLPSDNEPDAAPEQPDITLLRLYISGATPRSAQAIRNIKMIGELYLGGRYDLEVIDVYQHPDRAQTRDIVALPTLLKYFPSPARRVIGDLSDTQHVLQGLGLGPIE